MDVRADRLFLNQKQVQAKSQTNRTKPSVEKSKLQEERKKNAQRGTLGRQDRGEWGGKYTEGVTEG